MTRSTHLIAGFSAGLMIQSHDLRLALGLSVLAGVGSLMPDWDLRLGLKHRGVTHSLLALLVLALAAWAVAPGLPAAALAAGYGSHLLLDSLTVSGVPLLWPAGWRFRLARFVTGKLVDRLLGAGLSLLVLLVFVRWGR